MAKSTDDLLKDLDDVPSEDHLIADYWELRCLISSEGIYTGSELAAAIQRRRELGRAGAAGARVAVRRVAGPGSQLSELLGASIDVGEEPLEGDQVAREALKQESPDAAAPVAEVDTTPDEVVGRIGEIWSLIQRRARAFDDDYPFELEEDRILALPNGALRASQELYLYLLVTSSYRFLARAQDRTRTTTSFERLAPAVLKKYFGSRLQVHVFRTGAKQRSRYRGDLRESIERLSADTKLETTKRWDQHKQELSPGGDRGLDVVGWIPFDASDPEDLRLVLFGQCATGKNWQRKQLEASKPYWERSLDFSNPLTLVFLISFSWRDAGGRWPQTLKLASANIVFDRERIVKLLSSESRISDVPISLARDFRGLNDAELS